jgi:O-antigen/teichoic acid export membrane protein
MNASEQPRRGSGAGRVAFVRVSSAAAAFGLQLMLARLMSPTEFGVLVVAMTWIGLASALASLSMPLVAMRFIADYLARGALGAARAIWRYCVAWALVGSVSVALVLLVSGTTGLLQLPGIAGSSWMAVGLLVLVWPLLSTTAGQLQGLQKVITAELLSNLLRTCIVMIGAASLLWLAQRAPRAADLLWIHLGATSLLLVVCWFWGRAIRPPGWADVPPQAEPGLWRATAAGFFGVMVVGALAERIDVLVIGKVGSSEEIALYAVATRFSQGLGVLLVAVYGGLAPRLSAQLTEIQAGRTAAAQTDVTRFARIAALLAGSAALVFVLLGPWLLMLFGPAYREAGPALAVLGLGFVCACLFGPSLLVVTLAGRSRLTTAALLSGVVVNATLVAWLAPLWGATGAALGAAIGTVLPPMLCWWWLRRTLGLDAAVWARGPAVQQVQ